MSTRICESCRGLPPSGLWRVTRDAGFGRIVTENKLLCAACGMVKLRNRVRSFIDKATDERRFYHDVRAIELIASITRAAGAIEPGGLRPETLDVNVPGLSKGTIAGQSLRNAQPRTKPQIAASILNPKTWTERNEP